MSFRLRKGASVIAFAIAVRFQTRKLCEKLYMRVKGCSVGKTSKTLSLGPYYADVAQRVPDMLYQRFWHLFSWIRKFSESEWLVSIILISEHNNSSPWRYKWLKGNPVWRAMISATSIIFVTEAVCVVPVHSFRNASESQKFYPFRHARVSRRKLSCITPFPREKNCTFGVLPRLTKFALACEQTCAATLPFFGKRSKQKYGSWGRSQE